MPRRSRPIIGLLTAAVVVTAGCALPAFTPDGPDLPGAAAPGPAAEGSAAPPVTGSPTQWAPCPEVPREVIGAVPPGIAYDCATISVPQDWNEPENGRGFELSLIRARSETQTNRIGSLVVNPGGPGASGVDLAVYQSLGERFGGYPKGITDRFDIVGFDPRGVGRSSPVRCITPADQDAAFGASPDPVSDADFDAIVAINKRIAEGCGERYRDMLPLFATEQAAHDLDMIRRAVGDDKLTYLGYSYGTLLGGTYAQLYPQRVRALVLDGAVDPKQDFVAGSETQARGFERAFGNFATWCGQNQIKCPLFPDARAAVSEAIALAEASPVPGLDREATSGWVFLAVISSLYTETGWEQLANAVDDLRAGDPSGIFDLADQYADRKPDGTYSNMFDANYAVNCADNQAVPTVEDVRRYQSEWRAKYPMFGASLAVGMLPCVFWPGPKDPYPTGAAVGAPPVVVVGTLGDPATPYENTQQLASMLGNARVLTSEGEGHTAYPGSACITAAVDAYLIDLTPPAEGLRCPAR